MDTERTAMAYINEVYKRFGLPSVMISDRGPQFTSKVFEGLCKFLEIDHRKSTAYHPQTDGESERVNQEVEIYLRIFCMGKPEDWIRHLPMAEFTHNQRIHEATKFTPFMLLHGSDPVTIPTALPRTNVPTVEACIKQLQSIRDEALAAHELARQLMMKRSKGKFTEFRIGSEVWLDTRNLIIPDLPAKFRMKRIGPYKVTKRFGTSYEIKLPSHIKIHPRFHASLLTPFTENDIHGPNYLRPPPDVVEGSEEFEVEAIRRHQKRGNQWQYYVKWKGYPESDNSWEPARNLTNAEEILEEYKARKNLS